MTYDDDSFEPYRGKLREQLIKEQKGLCAYCCSQIDEKNAHNEHIEPRHPKRGVSKRSLDYHNVVASCYGYHGEETCGMHKDNEYDETKFVSPLNQECEDIFSYYPNGYMEGNQYTTELLNLNSFKLKEARAAVYNVIKNMQKEDIQLIYCNNGDELLNPFINVIRWYLKSM